MGVPGFFAWLLKKYKNNNIITTNIDDIIDILYIDANCLFHPQCFKVLNFYENTINIDKLEEKMIKRILVTASVLAFASSALIAPALAENGTSTASTTPAKHQPVVNLACVQAAVAKREAAVSAAQHATCIRQRGFAFPQELVSLLRENADTKRGSCRKSALWRVNMPSSRYVRK